MICYVLHCYDDKKENIKKARKTISKLQNKDRLNCYICPLCAFPWLTRKQIKPEDALEIKLDLLSCSDKLIVASKITPSMQDEIEFARLIGMEVEYIET